MIELRGLHLGNIARSPGESVRPDLWPAWALAPSLGVTGGKLVELSSGRLLIINGSRSWTVDGYTAPDNTSYIEDDFKCAYAGLTMALYGAWPDVATPMTMTIGDVNKPDYLAGIFQETANTPRGALYTDTFNACESPATVAPGYHAVQFRCSGDSRDLWVDGVMVRADTDDDNMISGNLKIRVNRLALADLYSAVGGALSAALVHPRELTDAELLALSADPLLPFRRRTPVYYSVPSAGGSTETPAAMMMAL